ncbi:hypothetical protein D3C72_2032200 [compost metagenome]
MLLRHARTRGQVQRHTATELQRERVLGFVVPQETLVITVEQGTGGDHLGVEQGVFRQQAQEEAAVAVGPIHHRRDGETAGERGGCGGGYGHGGSGIGEAGRWRSLSGMGLVGFGHASGRLSRCWVLR